MAGFSFEFCFDTSFNDFVWSEEEEFMVLGPRFIRRVRSAISVGIQEAVAEEEEMVVEEEMWERNVREFFGELID